MAKQSYSNHIRFYGPHHFIFYPIIGTAFCIALYQTYYADTADGQLLWGVISTVALAIIYAAYMMRQHYAMILQDRIIRLEMRYRYLALTGNRFEPFEQQLLDSQLFALRFCPDYELEALLDRTLKENLSGNKIKKSINNWSGDIHRV